MSKKVVVMALTTLILTACGTTSPTAPTNAPIENRSTGSSNGGYLPGDGPGASAPTNLDAIPDAVPKNEPLHRYANRPYTALEKTYIPLTTVGHFKQRGMASWYGKKFHGHNTSSGEKYDMYAMTAAHPTLPIPSYARVTNVATQKSVVVRINDRGPFLHGRVIDLSYTAAHKLDIISNGSVEVDVESITADTRPITQHEIVQSTPLKPVEPTVTSLPVAAATNSNIFLQLGAFSTAQAAEKFLVEMRAKLGVIGKQLTLYSQDNKFRVHIGPYASKVEARSSKRELHEKLGFQPMLTLH